MQFNYLNQVRTKNPLVHCITNMVVANYTANGLLALGASPLMSANPEEVAEIQNFTQGLLLNIGTLNGTDVEAMILAGKAANKLAVPVVLDPVGVGATACRKNAVAKLLAEVDFALIRGNAGEIASLAEVDWQAKGVDAGSGQADFAELSKLVAKKYQTIVAVSGETDFISDGKQLAKIANGSPLFPKITGSGCLLGAVGAAFVGVSPDTDYFNAVVEGCTTFAVAGELAAAGLANHQTGSFAVALLDQLSAITPATLQQRAKISYE